MSGGDFHIFIEDLVQTGVREVTEWYNKIMKMIIFSFKLINEISLILKTNLVKIFN